ncbi:MAG: hypothetical protein ABL965_11000 [Nitrospira sp.]|nr:hypothetical protein [Nitrospira sp.]THJ22587.1 MAG: hypothetical protein CAF44_005135 [Nitrospira sp. CG24D]
MPRKQPWTWSLKQPRPGHADRMAFIRAIPYEALDDQRNAAAGVQAHSAKQGQALSVNLSQGGMLLMMEGQPALQQQLRVGLRRNSTNEVASELVEVCWTRSVPALLQGGVCFVGVKFLRAH